MSIISKATGILGLNARTILYIAPHNPRKVQKFARDKLRVSKFLGSRGIPVNKMLASISSVKELEKFDWKSLPKEFVVKPNRGSMGQGILILSKDKSKQIRKLDGELVRLSELKKHILDIIDGAFSTGQVRDTAIIEQRIICNKKLAEFSHQGLPDIRIIVHNFVPVMAMLRLATVESGGRANKMAGGAMVGIDMATGKCTNTVHHDRFIKELPGVRKKIRGLKIPHWDEMLYLSAKIQEVTNIGYLAVDFALDHKRGPLVLEVNSHGGIAIQIPNKAFLRTRLDKVRDLKVPSPDKGAQISGDLFAEKKIKPKSTKINGRPVIGRLEMVKMILPSGAYQKLPARVTPTKKLSLIDVKFARELGLVASNHSHDPEHPKTITARFEIAGKRIKSALQLRDLGKKEYKVNFGLTDVSEFLFDPTKTVRHPKKTAADFERMVKGVKKINYKAIDAQLTSVNEKIKLLYNLTPSNLLEEKERFMKDKKNEYNPQFVYPRLSFNAARTIAKLEEIEMDESPIGILFDKKRREIIQKISLLQARGTRNFTDCSRKLYGYPSLAHRQWALEILKKGHPRPKIAKSDELTAEEVALMMLKVIRQYGLAWQVQTKEDMSASCAIGDHAIYLKKAATFNRQRVAALIAHEIETHVLTLENGKYQPYKVFQRGTADYLKTQEGLAAYNSEQMLPARLRRDHITAMNIRAVSVGSKESFVTVYKKAKRYGFTREAAWSYALKAKRGLKNTRHPGCFTRGHIYHAGKEMIKKYLRDGGQLSDLYIGKITLEDMEIIKQVEGMKKPKYLPEWLEE